MSREQIIVVGFGTDGMNEIIKEAVEETGVGRVAGFAMVRKKLVDRVIELNANMVIVGEDLVGEKETDEEWLDIVEELRRVDMYMRIVFVCKRTEEDLFLAKLALQGVTDIFNEGKLSAGWEEQLLNPPKFDSTERFRKQQEKATEQLRKRKREVTSPEEILEQAHIPQQEKKLNPAPAETKTEVKTEVKIVEKQVVKKEVVIEQVRVPSRSVVVLSLFDGAGSSLLTRMLAEYIAELQVDVGILESPISAPAWFEIINAWGLFSGNRGYMSRKEATFRQKNKQPVDLPIWESWHETVLRNEELPAWSEVFTHEKVKYIIRGPKDELDDWTENDTAHLLAYSRNLSVLFCDVSTSYDDPKVQILLRSADHIVAVGGYDVVRTGREHAKFKEHLERYYDKLHVIINKSTPRLERLHSGEIKSIYSVSKLTHVPAMTELFELYMEGDSFWKASFIREEKRVAMKEVIDELADLILGEEVMNKLRARKKGSLWQRMGAWFTQDDKEVEIDEGTA
ncbi:hypothetical protein ACFQI7_27570 [Paenibacillus allorhizosphaerae]|uniref:Uncharacterized protein n=1 Tax=Paenibacillus allorhizosphaerae TaxID=2849866 RepID=A0ABM8VNA7_9BACL|nr:hypothetical protein [Paenibacillus allorhizosphaerae]CAG7651211.1 hypothetical protein PAECIP111802_04906 [Paenibacillus allorhizosphaerae]